MKNLRALSKTATVFRDSYLGSVIRGITFFLVLTLFTAGPSSFAATAFDQKFNTLELKMTQDKVKSLLGAPDLREAKGTRETWHFDNQGQPRVVVFENGQLAEFGKDGQNAPPPEPAPKNLEIGESCKSNSECASQNCHLHACSGSDNCHVPLGKLCATNSDCCSGFCDFGSCKKK